MASDARYLRELEERCNLLERAFLIQEKRIWSLEMLSKLKEDRSMPGASQTEKERSASILRGNLRVAKEVLDRLALDLGHEFSSVFKILDPEFVYGAPGKDVGEEMTQQLECIDAREREAGTSHFSSMLRELKTQHDEFLEGVQEEVQRDVELNALFSSQVVEE